MPQTIPPVDQAISIKSPAGNFFNQLLQHTSSRMMPVFSDKVPYKCDDIERILNIDSGIQQIVYLYMQIHPFNDQKHHDFILKCELIQGDKWFVNSVVDLLEKGLALINTLSKENINNCLHSLGSFANAKLNNKQKDFLTDIITLIAVTPGSKVIAEGYDGVDRIADQLRFYNELIHFYKQVVLTKKLGSLSLEEREFYLNDTLILIHHHRIILVLPGLLSPNLAEAKTELNKYISEIVPRMFYKGNHSNFLDSQRMENSFISLLVPFSAFIFSMQNIEIPIQNNVLTKCLSDIVLSSKWPLNTKATHQLIRENLTNLSEMGIRVTIANIIMQLPLMTKVPKASHAPSQSVVRPLFTLDRFNKEMTKFCEIRAIQSTVEEDHDGRVTVHLKKAKEGQTRSLEPLFLAMNKRFKNESRMRAQYQISDDFTQIEISTESNFFTKWSEALSSRLLKEAFNTKKMTVQIPSISPESLATKEPKAAQVHIKTLFEKISLIFNKLSYGGTVVMTEVQGDYKLELRWLQNSDVYLLQLKKGHSLSLSVDELKHVLFTPLEHLLKHVTHKESLELTFNGSKLEQVVENGQLNQIVKTIIRKIRDTNRAPQQIEDEVQNQPVLEVYVLKNSPIELIRSILNTLIQPSGYAWIQELVSGDGYRFKIDLKTKGIKCLNKFVSPLALIEELVRLVNNQEHFHLMDSHLEVSKEWLVSYELDMRQLDHIQKPLQLWIDAKGKTYEPSGNQVQTLQPKKTQTKPQVATTKNYTIFFTPGFQQAYRTNPSQLSVVSKINQRLISSQELFQAYTFPYDAGIDFEGTLCAVYVASTAIRLSSICSLLAEQCGQSNKALFIELKKTLPRCLWTNTQADDAIALFSSLICKLPKQSLPQKEIEMIIQDQVAEIKKSPLFKLERALTMDDLFYALYVFSTLPLVTQEPLTSQSIHLDLLEGCIQTMSRVGTILLAMPKEEQAYLSRLYSPNEYLDAFFASCTDLHKQMSTTESFDIRIYHQVALDELNRFSSGRDYDARSIFMELHAVHLSNEPAWGMSNNY